MASLAALVARSVRVTANRRYLLYAPVLCGASALLFAKSFIYARLFSVENFGRLSQALLVASTFGNFAGAGLQLLGHKLLPQFYARGEQHLIEELLGGATRVFGAAALLVAGVFCTALLAGILHGVGLWAATLAYALAQSVFMLRLIDIKSNLQFLDHARLSTARAATVLLLGIAVAWFTGSIPATLAVEALVTLVLAAPLYRGSRGREIRRKAFGGNVDRTWLKANLPAALVLLWLSGTNTLLYSIDRWTGIALLDQREYGILSLGLLILVVFETLQVVVNVAAYPLMGRMIAEGQPQRAYRLATYATLVVCCITAVLYLPFTLALDPLLREFLPAYVASSTVIRLAVLAGALRLADFYSSFAVLCNEERPLAWLSGSLAAITVAAILALHYLARVQFDPDRIAVVTLAVAVCAFLLNFAVATRTRRRAAAVVPA
jgi:O-antigen/teichoic acid export membrane protein